MHLFLLDLQCCKINLNIYILCLCSQATPINDISNSLGPEYFYITTGDDTNSHLAMDDFTPVNYNIEYVQNSCK